MLSDETKKTLVAQAGNILATYNQLFTEMLSSYGDNKGVIEQTLNFETDTFLYIIGDILENNGRNAYVYLDHLQDLSSFEQKQINLLLYARGKLSHGNAGLFLKINNGLDSWKTWSTIYGQRVEATHDYSETTIPEKDLKEK